MTLIYMERTISYLGIKIGDEVQKIIDKGTIIVREKKEPYLKIIL